VNAPKASSYSAQGMGTVENGNPMRRLEKAGRRIGTYFSPP
jgi:hypothetical protein